MLETLDQIFVSFVAVDCGPLAVPINGSLKGSLTTFPSVITFECDRGFRMKGSSSRRCQANRRWSGTPTSCEGMFLLIAHHTHTMYQTPSNPPSPHKPCPHIHTHTPFLTHYATQHSSPHTLHNPLPPIHLSTPTRSMLYEMF